MFVWEKEETRQRDTLTLNKHREKLYKKRKESTWKGKKVKPKICLNNNKKKNGVTRKGAPNLALWFFIKFGPCLRKSVVSPKTGQPIVPGGKPSPLYLISFHFKRAKHKKENPKTKQQTTIARTAIDAPKKQKSLKRKSCASASANGSMAWVQVLVQSVVCVLWVSLDKYYKVCSYVRTHTHTHTHPHIYWERERETDRQKGMRYRPNHAPPSDLIIITYAL